MRIGSNLDLKFEISNFRFSIPLTSVFLSVLCGESLVAAAAGRRNDSVHAQVFHHLAVVVKGMGHGKRGAEELGRLSLAKRAGDKGQPHSPR